MLFRDLVTMQIEINKKIYKSESSERKEIPFNPKLIKYKEDKVID